MEKRKNYNIEIIRMISFVFVILIHVSNYYCREYGEISQGEYIFSLIINTLARVSVPCFFMISGALLLDAEPSLEKNASRLVRFLIVLCVWDAIYYLFNNFYMDQPFSLKEILYTPAEAHLWYLYALIPIYLVLPFFQIMCRGMSKRYVEAFLIVAVFAMVFTYGASLLNREAYYDVPLLGDRSYTFYFFMGYAVKRFSKQIPWRFPVMLLVFLGSVAANIGLTAAVTFRIGDHFERSLEYGCPLVMLSGVTFFMMMYKIQGGEIRLNERWKKWIDLFCTCSFGVYLIHILFLDNYKKFVEVGDISAYVAVPAVFFIITALSLLSVWLMRKTKVGRLIT